jgi:hypothetical protein
MDKHINPMRRNAFDDEIASATASIGLGNLGEAFRHLERAHVLGQVGAHVLSHRLMLRIALRLRKPMDVPGQAR